MRFYRECVRRQLHLNGGGRIHLSKNPTFCGRVAALIEAFPDARFVILYRNPHETIPSLLKLLHASWKVRDDAGRRRVLAASRASVELSFDAYLHPEAVLAQHPGIRHATIDYRELVTQPRATFEKVYADLGIPMTDAFRAVLQREEQRPRRADSEHRYSLEEFGLDGTEIRRRLEPFFERFGWDDAGAPAPAQQRSGPSAP